MNRYQKFISREFPVILICGIAFFLRYFFYKPHLPYWDAAVYLMMGKYLVSGGQAGFLEAFRPLPWPLFLGFIWKIGLDPILYGTIVEVLFVMGNIVLVYLIGKKVFDPLVGLAAAVFLSLSPSFFFEGNGLYADIPASFLGLLTVYLLLLNRFLSSGVVGAIASFTKFTQILPLIIIALFIGLGSKKELRLRSLMVLGSGFVVVSCLFLWINFLIYGHPFRPFYEAWGIYNQVSHIWYKEIFFCLTMLLKIESWFFIFVPFSLFILRGKNWQQLMILAVGLATFASIAKLPTYLDLPRYFILSIPYLYLLSGYGCVKIYRGIKQKHRVLSSFFLTLIVFSLCGPFYRLTKIPFRQDELAPLARYMLENEKSIKGRIWISNPKVVALTDLKIDELMYYPVFDFKKASQLLQKLPEADYIVLDSRALACRPQDDIDCERAKERLIKEITERFDAVARANGYPQNLTIGIFKRQAVIGYEKF